VLRQPQDAARVRPKVCPTAKGLWIAMTPTPTEGRVAGVRPIYPSGWRALWKCTLVLADHVSPPPQQPPRRTVVPIAQRQAIHLCPTEARDDDVVPVGQRLGGDPGNDCSHAPQKCSRSGRGRG